MPRNGDETRERIITAARKLLYRDGVRATSVDAIAEQAGITKRSLYYHFRSKDDLIEAYLTSRDTPNLEWFRNRFHSVEGATPDRIGAIFDGLVDVAKHPKWRGCGYLRTAGELANMPGHPAIKASSAHKKRLESWLAEEFEAAGLPSPRDRARQVVVLIDGAFSVMLVHHDPDYIRAAGEAARTVCRQPG